MTKTEFVARIVKACEQAADKGARFCLPVVVAQAALESGWGNSGLTQKGNNLFGIKAGKRWRGKVINLPTREWSKERGWYRTTAPWCCYDSWTACVMDYASLVCTRSWFRDALSHLQDSDGFLRALLPEEGQPGWATDPRYFSKVRAAADEIERLGGPAWA
jgi:flagellum-specific peptidoglycan hydrolase FlgJ